MPLTVKHLNADTTFLLTFSPSFAPANKAAQFPGSFTILIDPWLAGHSSILHPSFQISKFTTAPSIDSLAELKEQPDLILISQDKPDHCHRETLCSLPKDTSFNILATPPAAKKIRSWKHFQEDRIHELEEWDDKRPDTIVDITLPRFSENSADGLVTITNLVMKRDVTGCHNAVGITYRAPSTHTRNANGETIDLFDTFNAEGMPTLQSRSPSIIQPVSGVSGAERKAKQTTLSVLYSPHGVSPALVAPYASQHLARLEALPLTALFHSVNTQDNPWFMGGRVLAGAPGGVELVRKLGAKHWIGAHDEEKDNGGVSTLFLKSKRYEAEEVENMLLNGGEEVGQCRGTEIHMLEAGQELRIER